MIIKTRRMLNSCAFFEFWTEIYSLHRLKIIIVKTILLKTGSFCALENLTCFDSDHCNHNIITSLYKQDVKSLLLQPRS